MRDGVPPEWTWSTLGKLFEFKYGKGLPKENRNSKGSIRVYGSNGVVGTHNHAVTNAPAIIVGRKGSVGEIHLSADRCWPIDTTYFIDQFPDGMPPRYWALYLKYLHLGQQEKSSAIPGISRDDIYKIKVPVPPVPEQHRITAKLEELLAATEACQEHLTKVQAILKRFRQSVLAAACSGRLTADWRKSAEPEGALPSSWTTRNLADLCDLITKGASPKWQGVQYVSAGVLFVTSENVGRGVMLFTNTKYVEPKINEIQPRSVLRRGDILTNIVGASIGRSAIFDCGGSANMNQAVALIRLKKGISHEYVLSVLNSPALVEHMNGKKVDVARANLSLKDVSRFPIPLPPLPEQEEIVRRMRAAFALADQIEARCARAKAHAVSLSQSILAKAFRGEL